MAMGVAIVPSASAVPFSGERQTAAGGTAVSTGGGGRGSDVGQATSRAEREECRAGIGSFVGHAVGEEGSTGVVRFSSSGVERAGGGGHRTHATVEDG